MARARGTFLINNNPARKGHADYRLTSAGYFAAMRIPLLRGRTFDRSDEPNAPHAAVISQSIAQKYWPNEDPIGQTIQFGNMDGDLRLLHIVGVVGDVHDYGVDAPVTPTIYGNALQRLPFSSLTVVVRGQGEPAALIAPMREAVRSLDPQLPLKFRTLDQVFSSSLDQRRFSLVIFGVFAAAALLLAAMGIYGVTSYAVAQRTQEIGLRMALGAQAGDVLKLVLRNGMSLAFIGAAIGLAGAYAITRVMSEFIVRGCANRSRHVRDRFGGFDCGGAAGLFHTGAAGDESRSAGCVAVRVGRIGRTGPIGHMCPTGPIVLRRQES